MRVPRSQFTTAARCGRTRAGANIYHVELPNVGTMESNSPVMVNDVVVGSVGAMRVQGWHADVEISVKRDVVVPANVVAIVGQTSLLGSMHVELNTPLGQQGSGRLQPGATIPLSRSSAYPSTEQTLSSLGAVVNGGGLGQIGEVIHNFSAALSGREGAVRDLITRLDTFVGTLDDQRDNLVASIQALNRLAATFADQRDVVTDALRKIPPALEVLIKERPRLTAALDHLRVFSNTATRLINDSQADLVTNLKTWSRPSRRSPTSGLISARPSRRHSCSRSPRTSSTERFEATSSTCISTSTSRFHGLRKD